MKHEIIYNQNVNNTMKFLKRDCFNSIFEKKLYFVKSANPYLTKLHIQQLFEQKDIFVFNLDYFVSHQEIIQDLIRKSDETTLVLECLTTIPVNRNSVPAEKCQFR